MIRQSAGGACPLCGVAHAACGQAAPSTPVDIPTRKEPGVGPVRKYKVVHNGFETVMKLNDEDAKAYPDATLVEAEPAGEKAEAGEAEPKARAPQNKTRRAAADKTGN